MAGLRDRARWLAALALVAIALQVVSAFGHSHPPHGGGFHSKKVLTAAQTARSDFAAATDDTVTDRAPGGDGDTVCAICFVGHLVAAGVTGAPPLLALPVAYLLLGPPDAAMVLPRAPLSVAFWSRGPPLS